MIPGLKAIPAFNGGSGAGGVTSMTFVASATSSQATITIPGAAIAGDWAILFDAVSDSAGSSISSVTPAGWSTVKDDYVTTGSESLRAMVSHRVLTGGGIITGMSGSEKKIMLVFRSNASIGAPAASAWNGEATAGNPASQTVSASGVATPVIVFAFASTAAGTSPTFSTETPSMTNVTLTGTNISIRVGYTVYNSSPSDQSIDMNDVDVNALQSGYVRFT